VKREAGELNKKEFDLLVIGGGIHGACILYDAAMRGLTAGLIEKDDFGGANSANSSKIIHGGLRYLQFAKFQLARRLVMERTTWMRIAPHLVFPLPFVYPVYDQPFTRSKYALQAGIWGNNLISVNRNTLDDPSKFIPASRMISRVETRSIVPALNRDDFRAGALWYDCQVKNTERLTLAFIQSAHRYGGVAVNYMQAEEILIKDRRAVGVCALDRQSGEKMDIRARCVVNAAGAWAADLVDPQRRARWRKTFGNSSAVNFVTSKVLDDYGMGIQIKAEGLPRNEPEDFQQKLLFVVPWMDHSIVGAHHAWFDGTPEDFDPRPQLQSLLATISKALPEQDFNIDNIGVLHAGFLPTTPNRKHMQFVKNSIVIDHSKEDGTDRLITLIGVKYSLARSTAAKITDLAAGKIGSRVGPSRSHIQPLAGGEMENYDEFLQTRVRDFSRIGISEDVTRRIVTNYGSQSDKILSLVAEDQVTAPALTEGSRYMKAEILHAVREEMAVGLNDVVFRRTELGAAQYPTREELEACADLMGDELGWDEVRKKDELNQTHQTFVKLVPGMNTENA
jgi:glycerol-3-phosphate dehydrogenase